MYYIRKTWTSEERSRKRRGSEWSFDEITSLDSVSRRKRVGRKTHIVALMGPVLLALLELVLRGGGENSVAHSMSELDGGET